MNYDYEFKNEKYNILSFTNNEKEQNQYSVDGKHGNKSHIFKDKTGCLYFTN